MNGPSLAWHEPLSTAQAARVSALPQLSDTAAWSSTSATMAVAPDPAAVAQARSFARAVLADWALPGLVDTVELMVSELVTNALVHPHRPDPAVPIPLRLLRVGQGVRIEVDDADPAHQPRRAAHAHGEHLRGLQLVHHLAREHGTCSDGTTKTVWALAA